MTIPITAYLNIYVKAGLNIIPLKERGKIPVVKEWRPLVEQPLTINELNNIYRENPKLNIGIIMGANSGGLVVIDIDHSPPEELVFLIAQNPTTAVQTGRGRHYYYWSKQRLPNLKFDWGELRANNLYVVAPPSVHPSGIEYRFFDKCGLDQIAKIPDDLIKYFTATAKKAAKKDSVVRLNNSLTNSVVRLNNKTGGVKNEINKGVVSIELNIQSYYTLEDTLKDFEIAQKVIRLCGREVENLGEAFRCPIHKDERPSVALWRGRNGKIVLHEFHDGDHFITLAEVYAAFICRKNMRLKKGELIIWWLRALEDIGYIEPSVIKFKELPENTPESTKKLYAGFIRLLRLRKVYNSIQTAAPFSWSFALNWCGIGSMATVSKSMKWLLSNGYIKMVEKGCKIGEGTKAALFILGGE